MICLLLSAKARHLASATLSDAPSRHLAPGGDAGIFTGLLSLAGCRCTPGSGAQLGDAPHEGAGWMHESQTDSPFALLQAFGKARQGWLPFVGTSSVPGGRNVNIGTFQNKAHEKS